MPINISNLTDLLDAELLNKIDSPDRWVLREAIMPIKKKTILLLKIRVKGLFLNDDEPHLAQTILPPKDLSLTKD